MYTFTSVNNKFTIFGKPDSQKNPEYEVHFIPVGSVGRFSTNDEELVKKLRNHPEFGKKFMEIGVQARENPNIVRGIRGSSDHPRIGEAEQFVELGRLQATLLKKDGSYRKDASEEDKLKYEALKNELERE